MKTLSAGKLVLHSIAALAALALLAPIPGFAGDSWLQWGGPRRDFKTTAEGLASTWPSDGPEVVWGRELGPGYSTILAEDGRLYTMYRRDEEEVLVVLDAATGKTIWEYGYQAPVHENQSREFGTGPNATPLIVGDRIYTVGFGSLAHAIDKKKGKLLWAHDPIEEHGGEALVFGNSSSPIAYDGMVVFLVGGKKHAAVGYDLADGSLRWKSEQSSVGYSSPIIIDVGGEDQLVFMTPDEVVGVGLKDGAFKWRHHHENQYSTNCSSPWYDDDDLLFVSSQGDAGSRTLRLKRVEGNTEVEEIATTQVVKIFHNTAVRIGDYVYGSTRDKLMAHNIRSGEIAWVEDGYPGANLLMIDKERVIWLDEDGRLGLATMSPQGFSVLAEHPILEKPAWTAPTLAGSRLYLRDKSRIVALELGAPASAANRDAHGGAEPVAH
jgi:outer membrane protein assembly factor BamB